MENSENDRQPGMGDNGFGRNEVKLKNHEYDGQPEVRDIKVKLARESNDEWREKVNSRHETEAPIVCRRFDVL